MSDEDLKQDLWEGLSDLDDDQLVVGTSGNISVRSVERNGIWIKPSGVSYRELHADKMVFVRYNGVVEGSGKPSTDTLSHLVIYDQMPNVQAVVHTHSTFATAFAACGQGIDVCLTAHADEFGDRIPCSGYAEIGGAEVGLAVVQNMNRSGVVLIRNHGLFAVGNSIAAAYKKALMAEDVARTMWHARVMSTPIELTREQIESAYERYHTRYGQ